MNGSDPIDTVIRSREIEVKGFLMLPFSESVGDHRSMVLQVATLSMVGKFQHKIVYPACRRLTMSNLPCLRRYIARLKDQMDVHNMEARADKLEAVMVDYPATATQMAAAERLDVQMIEIQRAAENKCRKINKPDLPAHSLLVKYWSMRRRSYMELIKNHRGKVRNVANVMNRAKAHGIPNPRFLTLSNVWMVPPTASERCIESDPLLVG